MMPIMNISEKELKMIKTIFRTIFASFAFDCNADPCSVGSLSVVITNISLLSAHQANKIMQFLIINLLLHLSTYEAFLLRYPILHPIQSETASGHLLHPCHHLHNGRR